MSDVTLIGEKDFQQEVLQSDLPVLVDFFAVWCPPCRAVAPIIDQLAADFAGKLKVVKIDIDQSPVLTDQYGIQGVPTFVVFKGGQEATRLIGAFPRDAFLQALRPLLG